MPGWTLRPRRDAGLPPRRVARDHLLLAVAILGLIAAVYVLRRLGG